jgi:hypothetical protein
MVEWVEMTPETTNPKPGAAASANPRKAGRRPIYHEEIVATICAAIRASGVADAKAAIVAGVTKQVFRHWKHHRPDFAQRVAEARGAFHEACLAQLRLGSCRLGLSPERWSGIEADRKTGSCASVKGGGR